MKYEMKHALLNSKNESVADFQHQITNTRTNWEIEFDATLLMN